MICLRWNLVLRLIRLCRIQWCCSLFCVFNRKYPFRTTLVENIKIFTLRWNLVPRVIRIGRIQWWYSLFLFRPKIFFWKKFDPKNEICQFKLKFGTQNNLHLQNSLAIIHSFCLLREIPFLVKILPKSQNCQFKLRFESYNQSKNILG